MRFDFLGHHGLPRAELDVVVRRRLDEEQHERESAARRQRTALASKQAQLRARTADEQLCEDVLTKLGSGE